MFSSFPRPNHGPHPTLPSPAERWLGRHPRRAGGVVRSCPEKPRTCRFAAARAVSWFLPILALARGHVRAGVRAGGRPAAGRGRSHMAPSRAGRVTRGHAGRDRSTSPRGWRWRVAAGQERACSYRYAFINRSPYVLRWIGCYLA